MAYVTTLTYASTNDRGIALLAHWSVRQNLNSLVQFSYVAVYAFLNTLLCM